MIALKGANVSSIKDQTIDSSYLEGVNFLNHKIRADDFLATFLFYFGNTIGNLYGLADAFLFDSNVYDEVS